MTLKKIQISGVFGNTEPENFSTLPDDHLTNGGNALCIRGSLNEDQDLWSDSFGWDLYHQEPGSSTKGSNGNQMMMKPTFSIPGKLKMLIFQHFKAKEESEGWVQTR